MLQSAFLKPNMVGTTATGLSLSRLTITIMDSKVVKESLVVFKSAVREGLRDFCTAVVLANEAKVASGLLV